MVQEIKKTYDHAFLGVVRLQAHELIEILKNNLLENENVIVEVNNIRFNGIDDLERNISLCKGQSKIIITNESDNGEIEIEIGKYNTRITSLGSYVDSAHVKYYNIIKEFHTLPSRLNSFFPLLLILLISVFAAAFGVEIYVENINTNFSLYLFVLALLISFVMVFASRHTLIFSGGVEYIGRKGLFRRNLDKIFVGVVTLIASTILGLLIKLLLE